VYLRIKEAMELAEEARLERDAARTETDALQAQLATAQVRQWGTIVWVTGSEGYASAACCPKICFVLCERVMPPASISHCVVAVKSRAV
jgi:hypothetical protein